MENTVVVEHKAYLLLHTIHNLGFKLVDISNRIYPSNHPNYLSGRFSEQRIKPKDKVLIVNYLVSQVGESVFDLEYNKEIDKYNQMLERRKAHNERKR